MPDSSLRSATISGSGSGTARRCGTVRSDGAVADPSRAAAARLSHDGVAVAAAAVGECLAGSVGSGTSAGAVSRAGEGDGAGRGAGARAGVRTESMPARVRLALAMSCAAVAGAARADIIASKGDEIGRAHVW